MGMVVPYEEVDEEQSEEEVDDRNRLEGGEVDHHEREIERGLDQDDVEDVGPGQSVLGIDREGALGR